ncbi:MAG: DUF4013 domain-containing protein [Methanomicrobiales archaeon]|nr:DUF4013 domain-containing protein [Methanomicrobiales archaeon]NYT21268.1 DUF4013 domain-containing protein [Methanomicrobiales archaeon]
MDIGTLIGDSFEYAKDGLLGNPVTWILLIVLSILPVLPFIPVVLLMLPSLMTGTMPDIPTLIGMFAVAFVVALLLGTFYMGYMLKIFRGETPLPAVSGYGRMFSDGIGYLAIEIIYAIPVLIILGVTIGGALMAALSAGPDFGALLPLIGGVVIGIFIALIVGFIIGLIATIGIIRFSRTGRMGEAFNFSAITGTIGRIGWGSYILALIIGVVIIVIVQLVLGMIPYLGGILQLIVSPFVTVFFTRYITLVYESGEPPAPAPAPAVTP